MYRSCIIREHQKIIWNYFLINRVVDTVKAITRITVAYMYADTCCVFQKNKIIDSFIQ